MINAAHAIRRVLATAAQVPDGRRARSFVTRSAIIKTMVELVAEGNPDPGAVEVAERSGISLRTVFRHFEEMENLHLEIAAQVFERVRPILDQPLERREWPVFLDESVARRAEFFEILAPFKTAIDVHRHRSRAIAAQHRRITVMSRDLLAAALPAEIVSNQPVFELLTLLLSIETWQRLREQQGMTVAEAQDAVLRAVRAVAQTA